VTRILVFSLTGFLLITLLGSLERMLGLEFVAVDVPLVAVLYMALAGRGAGYSRPHRSSLLHGGIDWSGGVTGVVLGYVTDVMGGGVKGIHALTMALLYLLTLWVSRHIYLAGNLSVIVVTFVSSAIASALAVAIRWLTGVPPSLATIALIASQAVLCAAVAPLLMKLFRFIDSKLSRDASERGSLSQ
jgi:rod shape-determining protein MreD